MKRSIKSDYLENAAELRPFYEYRPEFASFPEIIRKRKNGEPPRELLATQIARQYTNFPDAEKTLKNVESLRESNVFTVTTGHQLCLMGGPLFTLHKITNVIKLAEELTHRFPEIKVVPVFWIASEDHDAEEIDHYFTSFDRRWHYKSPISGAVGRHELTEEVLKVVPEKFHEFFKPGRTLSEAYRRLIHHIFGDRGLVILDADDPELKRAFLPVMRRELLESSTEKKVQETSGSLEESGYKTQVHPREINLFYLSPGRRDRIVKTENGFEALDFKDFNQKEILAELESHPERFSPNVILRPVYQEFILPNLAYAGGWGELSYWMQFKSVFEHFEVPFPMLVPRTNATLIEPEICKEWKEMGFDPADFALDLPQLYEKYIPNFWQPAQLNTEAEKVLTALAGLEEYAKSEEPTLGISVAAQTQKFKNFRDRLEKKIKKVVRNQNRKEFDRIKNLKNQVRPGRTPQERVLNFSAFEVPAKELVTLIYQNCEPLNPSHLWITLPEKKA